MERHLRKYSTNLHLHTIIYTTPLDQSYLLLPLCNSDHIRMAKTQRNVRYYKEKAHTLLSKILNS